MSIELATYNPDLLHWNEVLESNQVAMIRAELDYLASCPEITFINIDWVVHAERHYVVNVLMEQHIQGYSAFTLKGLSEKKFMEEQKKWKHFKEDAVAHLAEIRQQYSVKHHRQD